MSVFGTPGVGRDVDGHDDRAENGAAQQRAEQPDRPAGADAVVRPQGDERGSQHPVEGQRDDEPGLHGGHRTSRPGWSSLVEFEPSSPIEWPSLGPVPLIALSDAVSVDPDQVAAVTESEYSGRTNVYLRGSGAAYLPVDRPFAEVLELLEQARAGP